MMYFKSARLELVYKFWREIRIFFQIRLANIKDYKYVLFLAKQSKPFKILKNLKGDKLYEDILEIIDREAENSDSLEVSRKIYINTRGKI
jgi:hypothetical protein